MALFRALESARPPASRLFHDPYAVRFLKPSFRVVVGVSRLPLLRDAIPRIIDAIAPGARSSGVARTRLIDDFLEAELRCGIEQLVILGAGYDCRTSRVEAVRRVRAFELDHPVTLAEKRRALPNVLPQVRYVGVDLDRQSAAESLAATDYSSSARTFFIWEGVTNYLSAAAVDATLRWLGTANPGSGVVMTYVDRDVLERPARYCGAERLLRTLQRLGEPWLFGLHPVEVHSYLAARGLRLVEDMGAADYRARYLAGRRETNRGYEFYRVAFARVAAEEGA